MSNFSDPNPQRPGYQPPAGPPPQPGPGGPQQPPGSYGPPQTPPPVQPPKRRWFLRAPVVAVAALVLGIIIGSVGGGESGSAGEPGAAVTVPVPTVTATATATATQTVESTKTVKAKPRPQKTVTVTAAPADDGAAEDGAAEDGAATEGATGEIGDGTYLVGDEIAPGNYKSSGGSGIFCYADTQNEAGDILQQEVSQGEPVVIRIKSDAYTFTSTDCGTWTKVG